MSEATPKRTGNYTCARSKYYYASLIPIDRFKQSCARGGFIDYDGEGYAAKGDLIDDTNDIFPSTLSTIPADATHILWFNR